MGQKFSLDSSEKSFETFFVVLLLAESQMPQVKFFIEEDCRGKGILLVFVFISNKIVIY